MQFKQFYLGCLSHASYYLGSKDEGAIIDPQRDVQQYIDEAEANGQKIKYVIETHSHADFVSGHVELAEKTGAEIVFGERADTGFATHKVKDGDTLTVGDIKLTFLETPGHTPEGITILAENTASPGEAKKLFTGDTLFVGDVGRPDLVGSKGYTAAQMGEMLYDSLHNKILPLPDETEIYPAHGAGSLCGKSLSDETWSTLGNQRRLNYALQPMTRDEFVKIVSADQPEVPAYFPTSAAKNLSGAAAIDEIAKPQQLSTDEVIAFDGVVVDVRASHEYGAGHVPNSINIGLGGQFASWAGSMIPIGTRIAVVADTEAQVDEAFTRLARVGHESVAGFALMGNYTGEKTMIERVSVKDVYALQQAGDDLQIVDVRRANEYANGHVPGVINIPLNELPKEFEELDPSLPTYLLCQGGYRSSLGAGILENAGFAKIYDVTGGTSAWISAGLAMEVFAPECRAQGGS